LVAGCTGEPGASELDQYLCPPEGAGAGYRELTRGDFTPADLAGLSADAEARERDYRAAGMENGKFVFYKQSLSKPPFNPPWTVVCQVIEFETATQAEAWVSTIDPAGAHSELAFGRLPDERLISSETPSFAGTRRFLASGGPESAPTSVTIVAGADHRFVRIVAVGVGSAVFGPVDGWLTALWDSAGGRQ